MHQDALQRLIRPFPDYDGPQDFWQLVDFLPHIGEVVLGFARMERWLTWGIESALQIHPQQADAIQESIKSVTTRIDLFYTLAKPHSRSPETDEALEHLVKRLKELNGYRNRLLHDPWFGVSEEYGANGTLVERGAMKARYAGLGSKTLDPKHRLYTKEEMRINAVAMIDAGNEVYRWVCTVFLHCEKRVP
jgi:hypothetical protein